MKLVSEGVGNIEGKGENVGYQYFLLFPQSLQNTSYPGWLKVGILEILPKFQNRPNCKYLQMTNLTEKLEIVSDRLKTLWTGKKRKCW